AIGLAKLMDLIARETLALEPDNVEPAKIGAIADGHPKWDDVGGDPRHSADKCVGADAHELVYGGEPADNGAIANRDVTAQGGSVHQRHAVADFAIVSDMRADHQEAVGPDLGRHMAAFGTRIDGGVFPNDRFGTDS